jgi:glycosyltransferase involved in cell wall biosynthesis
MPRFAGIKDGQIRIISNNIFSCSDFQIIELDEQLENVPVQELITDYKFKNGKIVNHHSSKNIKEMKIALVGNWKMRCGIATYSENLWAHVVDKVGDYKLFIEDVNNFVGAPNVIGDMIIPDDKMVACWKRGESLQNLIDELKAYEPDIIWIQHEFGLWPNAGYWLSMMSQLSDYRVIVTMHSVFHHRDKTICEAAMPEIVTHLQGGCDVLKLEKQVPGKVYMVPHGCDPCVNGEKLWNFYKSEHTFMQFGFGFRYKGWENCIKAVALLKEKYKDVFFTGLFSESDYNAVEHHLYYNELMDLANKLNVKENIAIIRGFQSDTTLDSYLRTNQVILFPYISHPAHEVFGASGAARLAMSKAAPVITSSVNHFSDLPSLKADTPEEMSLLLSKLFFDKKFCKEQIEKQNIYLSENTWEKVALKYISIFENKD